MNFGEAKCAERRAAKTPDEGANAAHCLEKEATIRDTVIGKKRAMLAIVFDYWEEWGSTFKIVGRRKWFGSATCTVHCTVLYSTGV